MLVLTAVAIVATDLLEGVLIGLVAALVKLAWQVSRLRVEVDRTPAGTLVRLHGGATFLGIPKLRTALDALPPGDVRLDLSALTHLDRTSRGAVEEWARQRREEGANASVDPPPGAAESFADTGAR